MKLATERLNDLAISQKRFRDVAGAALRFDVPSNETPWSDARRRICRATARASGDAEL